MLLHCVIYNSLYSEIEATNCELCAKECLSVEILKKHMENHQVEAENDKFAKFLREKETNMKTMNVIELFELVDEI